MVNENLRGFIYAALFSALIIVLGFVSIPIPISPVPISGISLGVMLAGSCLKSKQAFYSVLTVILLGAIGLPVFSGFTGGIGILLGPRGGYYFGFLFAAFFIAFFSDKNTSLIKMILLNFIGGIVIAYLFAVPWLAFVTQMNWKQAFYAGALPFIIGDVIKVFIASTLAVSLNRRFGLK